MKGSDYLRQMASYHQWAGQRLLAAVAALPEEEYRRPSGLFFGSVHGTLNHLLLADRLWYGRLRGAPYAMTGLDQEIVAEREDLAHAIVRQAQYWQDYLAGLSAAAWSQDIDYVSSTGQPFSLSREAILMHVFNHATHHRGQISALITRAGRPCPEMDLVYQLLE